MSVFDICVRCRRTGDEREMISHSRDEGGCEYMHNWCVSAEAGDGGGQRANGCIGPETEDRYEVAIDDLSIEADELFVMRSKRAREAAVAENMLAKRRPTKKRLDDNEIGRILSNKKSMTKRPDSRRKDKPSSQKFGKSVSRHKSLGQQTVKNEHFQFDGVSRHLLTGDYSVDWLKVEKTYFSHPLAGPNASIAAVISKSVQAQDSRDDLLAESNLLKMSRCMRDVFLSADNNFLKVLTAHGDSRSLLSFKLAARHNIRGKLPPLPAGSPCAITSSRSLLARETRPAGTPDLLDEDTLAHLSLSLVSFEPLDEALFDELIEKQTKFNKQFIKVMAGELKTDNTQKKIGVFPKTEIEFLSKYEEKIFKKLLLVAEEKERLHLDFQ